MKVSILQNTLDNFHNKLGKRDLSAVADGISNAIAHEGLKYAQELWGSENVKLYTTDAINGNSQIIAEGKGVSFVEFGTGVQGEGTYKGNLPTQNITFESPKGTPRQTQGWVYNYMKKLYVPYKPDHKGHKAFAPMFYTAQKLRSTIPTIVKNYIKGEMQ